jgi:Tfp pilus assembly protein PilO
MGKEMSEATELSKWAGAGIALLAASGGYIGSVSSQSEDQGALKQTVETLVASMREHDQRERSFEESIRNQMMDMEARVRVLESRK